MRFEAVVAIAYGILLPALETIRRGLAHWSVDFTTMFTDYLGGALLLIGGWASLREKPWARLFLVVAWAYVASMMSGSFWGQLEQTLRGASDEPNNLVVVVVKFLLWSTSVVSLVMTFRGVSGDIRRARDSQPTDRRLP